MPENSVRPRKPRPRDSAIAASVPSTVAIVADTVATRKLIHAASSMARSLKNSEYQRSDQPRGVERIGHEDHDRQVQERKAERERDDVEWGKPVRRASHHRAPSNWRRCSRQ